MINTCHFRVENDKHQVFSGNTEFFVIQRLGSDVYIYIYKHTHTCVCENNLLLTG